MTYQHERDTFIAQATKEGLSLPVITKLLRYAATLQRLAEAQCNGDYPYNGDRDRPNAVKVGDHWERDKAADERHDRRFTVCPKCETSGVCKSQMHRTIKAIGKGYSDTFVCPDCRTQELVRQLLLDKNDPHHKRNDLGIMPIFGGDPRGAVLRLSTPNFPYTDNGANGSYGLCVPARSR